MNRLKIVLSLIFIITSNSIFGQSYSDIANQKTGTYSLNNSEIVGLWEVGKVIVGEELLTPTAKWFMFEADGTLHSGNGWIQNGLGSYNYDEDTKTLLQANQGVTDEYGAFQVTIEGQQMTWKRVEDGTPVTVTLSKSIKKPLGPWDQLQARWVVEKAEGINPQTGKLVSEYIMNPDIYFFMWDRRYRKYDETGKIVERGVWHIGAHSDQLWMITNSDNSKTEWKLDISKEQMIWTRTGEKELLKVYLKKEH